MQLRMGPGSRWVDRAVCQEQKHDEEERCQGLDAKVGGRPLSALEGRPQAQWEEQGARVGG